MIEFSFRVRLSYRSAQAFNDEDLDRVHDRLNKRIFTMLTEEFDAYRNRVVIETEAV